MYIYITKVWIREAHAQSVYSNQCERNTMHVRKDNNLKNIRLVNIKIVLLFRPRNGQQSSMLNWLPRTLEPSIAIHARKCQHIQSTFS